MPSPIIRCSDCANNISARAWFCPHCGAPNNRTSGFYARVFYATLLVILTVALVVGATWFGRELIFPSP